VVTDRVVWLTAPKAAWSLGRTRRWRESPRLPARGFGVPASELTATLKVLPGQVRELWERAGQAPATRRHDRLDYPEVGARKQPELAQLVGRDAPIAGDDQFTWVVVTKCAHATSIRRRL